MIAARWERVEAMLDRFEQAGRTVKFWLRDDDAIEPTPALDRLIELCETYNIPLLLAVIPEPATGELAARIGDHTLLQPCQHGFNHRNHAPEGVRARELGLDRPLEIVLGDLARGSARLMDLFHRRLRPVLVPPWNRIDTSLRAHLPSIGFQAISTIGRSPSVPVVGLTEFNAHLDIIDWRKGHTGRDHGELVGALVTELEIAFANDEPIGVLGHHLVHDETAWDFLATFFAATARHRSVRWISVDALIHPSPVA